MLNETKSLHLIEPPTLDEVRQEIAAFLATPSKNLQELIKRVAFQGGADHLIDGIQCLPVFRMSNTSGFNYSFQKSIVAYLRFGITTSGYFVVQSLILNTAAGWVSHYYHADGTYAFSEGPITHTFAENSDSIMESACPILNHLYCILNDEYQAVKSGKTTNSKRVHTIESSLQRLGKTRFQELSISKKMKDPSVLELNRKMMEIDLDPVYTWKERHQFIQNLKSERDLLIQTKTRAHRKSLAYYAPARIASDFIDALKRLIKRPLNNLAGLLDHVCLDPIRWFMKVVRSNMGYSVALAIYSPFTYFFITQPMNPHATFAVGKVRSAYIQVVEGVQGLVGVEVAKPEAKSEATGLVITPEASAQAASRGMLLTTDVPAVNEQSWEDRMSHFKNMQNSYESNMESAPRMGRLEQMETQLNWPLIVESAWNETERYMNFLNFIELNSKDYLNSFVAMIKAEKARTEQVQLYLWDRNIRFILDHPFTMMDQTNEQSQLDYYVGRAFIQLRDMTNQLAFRYKNLQMPKGYEAIVKLASHFESDYKANVSVLERLKNNSKLFAQDDKYNSDELRSYMKRQWEILYLLQSRAQEGAVHALQMQVWSVRNMVWLIQSLYSTKREEMSTLALALKPGAPINKLTGTPAFKKIDSQYESLFHMMVLEYTSIRKELGEELKNDIEATQRKTLIDGMEKFLQERDSLLKSTNLL